MSAGWLVRPLSAIWSHLKEVTGEADYDRYLDRHRIHRPDVPTLSRGDYWRARWELDEGEPGSRCC